MASEHESRHCGVCGYSTKRAGVQRACPNKVMAHTWFIHDAHLGRALLFLDILADYTFLLNSVMVTPRLWLSWNEVGDVLRQVFSSRFCTRSFWRLPSLEELQYLYQANGRGGSGWRRPRKMPRNGCGHCGDTTQRGLKSACNAGARDKRRLHLGNLASQ